MKVLSCNLYSLCEVQMAYNQLMKEGGESVPLEEVREAGIFSQPLGECRLLIAFDVRENRWMGRLDRGVQS